MLTQSEFLKLFAELQLESYDLVDAKNSDYGFSFVDDGYEGVLVRLTDKLNRLRTLSSSKGQVPEALSDTLTDLANYAHIAQICLIKDIHSPVFVCMKFDIPVIRPEVAEFALKMEMELRRYESSNELKTFTPVLNRMFGFLQISMKRGLL